MNFCNRRFVTLGALAILFVGTAIASHRVASSSFAQVSNDRLLQQAYHANQKQFTKRTATLAQEPQPAEGTKSRRREFTVYRNEAGEITCREATPDEIKQREGADLSKLGLRQINHPEFDKASGVQAPEATNLIIILRATSQLQQNAAATAAFNRAAQNWENVIMSPITIYIDVDYGSTDFGTAWPSGVIGATGSPSRSFTYQSVRANLIAEAAGEGNANKQGIFNALPSTTVPTDLGNATGVDVSDSNARAIGLLPATAQGSDDAAQIAFNSSFTFDFDPSNGISANAIDFDAVATHEIGHALGFDSDAGMNAARPAVWDLYRFRTGTTSASFPTAQRILTVGGSPDPLQFDFVPGNSELGLSNGGPDGSTTNGGDGNQSSHWKESSGCSNIIGIMDPAIPNGCRRTITANDMLALASFGYNLTNNNPPPPPPASPTPPANDNFANAQIISGCSGTVTGSTFGATSETSEPSHDPTDSTSLSPGHTIWYRWQATSSSSTTITTAGSDFDTILAVYTGSTLSTLSRLTFNDDVQNGVIRTSSVTFNATAGTTYSIAVDGWGGDVGTVNLNWAASGCTSPSPTPTPTPTPSCPGETWVATSLTNAPVGRDGHTAVWTGTEMIVWGGLNSSGTPLNTGSKYNPTSDTWTDITTTNAPAARAGHVAVWTGTEMIIWGGGSFLNTGAKYNPTTDTWTSISTVNAPSARTSATAVWTGTEMIVWGGVNASAGLNSGGRYNPTTDTWVATNFANSPSPRFGHSMIWTGTEAVVWGGSGSGTLQDSGARYNPGTDTWTTMGKTNAPTPRANHTAIWDGTEMIVWGGGPTSPNTALTNNGAKYFPSTDTWIQINSSNAPSPRAGHRAVWTGIEMIVWGGVDNNNNVNNGYLNTGGRYKPATDTWTTSCATNAPAARTSFSIVWTGQQTLIWGGSNPTRLNTGARYSAPNAIDDASFFVKQQYLDFLNRQPDQAGWDFWTNQITSCGSDAQCTQVTRVNTSGAFFLSIEFQQTGNLVYKMYKAGFGNLAGKPVAVDRAPFIADTRQIQSTPGQVIVNQTGWQAQLETNKQAFALAFVQRAAFQTAHASQSAAAYVNSLFQNAGVTPTAAETTAAVNAFNNVGGGDTGRAAALRSVAESNSVATKVNNEAFVLMQYFGYLQRNPNDLPDSDYSGFNFWLAKLNQFNGDFIAAEMVKAFISSSEYRQRFGP